MFLSLEIYRNSWSENVYFSVLSHIRNCNSQWPSEALALFTAIKHKEEEIDDGNNEEEDEEEEEEEEEEEGGGNQLQLVNGNWKQSLAHDKVGSCT